MRIVMIAAVAACMGGAAWAEKAPAPTAAASEQIDGDAIQRVMERYIGEAVAEQMRRDAEEEAAWAAATEAGRSKDYAALQEGERAGASRQ